MARVKIPYDQIKDWEWLALLICGLLILFGFSFGIVRMFIEKMFDIFC